MKARYDSPIVPLEFAYDGLAPDKNAQLCDCVSGPSTHPAAAISHASKQTVCPYAFWGMNRVITRSIVGQRVKRLPSLPRLAPLSLQPIVYGATDEADDLSPPWASPTKEVEYALIRHVGHSRFARVSNWRAWRRVVRRAKPELLVVLGHTEMRDGEPHLIIGRNSGLAHRSVSLRELGATSMPAPLVLLFGCTSGVVEDGFGVLPGTIINQGAAAVVAPLTKLGGADAAKAAVAVVSSMHSNRPSGLTLAAALTEARRQLIAQGLLVGLMLMAHGNTDIRLTPPDKPHWQ